MKRTSKKKQDLVLDIHDYYCDTGRSLNKVVEDAIICQFSEENIGK